MTRKKWLRHAIFWLISLLILTVYFMGSEYGRLFNILLYVLNAMPVFILYTYISFYIILPYTFRSGKFYTLILYFPIAIILFSFLLFFFTRLVYFRYVEPENLSETETLKVGVLAVNALLLNFPLFMFGSAKLLRNYFLEMKKKNEIESKNMEAELCLLSTQLHPHFLFNTLNNLYSLALSGSGKTAVSLRKINGLMKYILFECGQTEISIQKEINLIDNYLELEKLRYDKRLKVSFETGQISENIMIAPMILFTFVENCFKHGSSKATGNSYIRISLNMEGENLIFRAENSKPPGRLPLNNDHKGLGLENVKKRLLYLYPEKHWLTLSDSEKEFKVELVIKQTLRK